MSLVSRRVRQWCALPAICLAASMPRFATAQASPYVPLGDAAYAYIDVLMARGALRALSALERPYTVAAVRAAVLVADTSAATGDVRRGWAARLLSSLGRIDAGTPSVRPMTADSAAVWVQLGAGVGVVAQTSGQRNLMRADDLSGLFPSATLRGSAVAGPVVAAARMHGDNRLRDDPDFVGKKDRFVRGRMEEAYVAGQWTIGELFFGRQARNWGPVTVQGLQLGDAAYSYDHLYAQLGPQRAHISTLITKLDDAPSLTAADAARPDRSPTGPLAHRYFAVHRVAARLHNVEFAGSESYLYSGVNRGLSFSLSNPLTLYNLAQYNEGETGNVAYSLDLASRTSFGLLSGQFFLDDFQVDRCTPSCHEPASYGVTASAEGLPVAGDHRGFVSYTRVTSLVYRTPDPTERYSSYGVSLGRDASDYDEVRAGLDLALDARVVLRPYAAHRRQGSGDFHQPFPLPVSYASLPTLLIGPVTRIDRVAVEGGTLLTDGLRARFDVGANRASGANARPFHVEGRLTVELEPTALRLSTWLR